MVTTLLRSLVLTAALAATFMPSTAKAEEAQAIERASGDRLSKAVGHYSRARMYLLAAIKEFDQGMRSANANTMLDTGKFRATLVNRAQELERVLDPQPRVSHTGVKFSGDPKLIGEAR